MIFNFIYPDLAQPIFGLPKRQLQFIAGTNSAEIFSIKRV
jgi:hypothetical protein